MKKLGAVVFSLFLVKLVSAVNFGGFNLYNFFDNFAEYLPYVLIFLFFFWVIYYLISRTGLIQNDGISAGISVIISAFGLYGFNRSGFSIDSLGYKYGLSFDFLFDFIPWIVLLFAVFFIWKWGIGMLFMVFGSILFLVGIFGIASESGLASVLGIVLLILGYLLYKRRKKKVGGESGPDDSKEGRGFSVVVEGIRYNSPFFKKIFMSIPPNRGSKISVENRSDDNMRWHVKLGSGLRASPTNGVIDARGSNEVKIFSDNSLSKKVFFVYGKSYSRFRSPFIRPARIIVISSGSPEPSPDKSSKPKYGPRDLIKEAKALRKWADKQKNPSLYRTWAYFIKWLKDRKYGSNEKEIISNFGERRDNFIKVIKKYIN